jgi:membrane-bound ClpP family serine protease
VSALGIGCVAVGVVLVLFEAHLSTGGWIAAGALVALVGGVAMLLMSAAAGPLAVLAVSGAVGIPLLAGLVVLVRSAGAVRRLRPRSGSEAMVGHLGVLRAGGASQLVFVDGQLWRARPSPLDEADGLQDGDPVVVEHVSGLTVYVRKAEELERNP